MQPIEIYTEIMAIVEKAKPEDANIAIQFVQSKIYSEMNRGANLTGGALASQSANSDYYAKRQAEVVNEVRSIVRDVLSEDAPDAKKEAA